MKGLYNKVVVVLISIVIAFSGCKKDVVQPDMEYDSQKISSCFESKSWDYTITKSHLLGLWEWQYGICCGESSKQKVNDTESKGLKIEFMEDGKGVMVDFDAIGEFTWDIQIINNVYEFSTDPYISQLEGHIVVCDNILIIDAGYKDGAINYFKRNN